MARPFNPYEPELNKLSSNGSPMSPYPRGDSDTPLSFKTNVNRAKTKRWVEAKKYSYDGNDWGDDEYGEYDDEDEIPPLPQSTHLNQSTPDISGGLSRDRDRPQNSPLPSMDRSRSMDQVATLGVNDAGDSSRSRSVDRTVPIVRPAEIYNRIRGNTAGRAQAPESGLATGDSHGVGPSQTDSVPQGSLLGIDTYGDPLAHQSFDPSSQSGNDRYPEGNDTPVAGLPDVKRLSGFGSTFMGDSDPRTPTDGTNQPQPQPQPQQEHQLHHNPSLGFRSVVHQAFDVPETPTTTLESVGRSNSDSTSVISPIMGQRTTSDNRTSTIVEEPEASTPPRGFKPGHRRDLSIPSPGNSPSRKPEITNNHGTPPSALAEMSHNIPEALRGTSPTSPGGEEGMPAPLKLSNSSTPVPNEAAAIPVIVPSMSTDNSPQDTENDRLRKDILRSLSRENTPSDEPEPHESSRPQTSRQESLIPSEYERYWSENPNTSPQEQRTAPPPIPAENPSQDYFSPQQPSVASPATQETVPEPGHKLQRKFSWESSSSASDMVHPAVLQTISPEPMPGQFPDASEVSSPPDAHPMTREVDDSDREEQQPEPQPQPTPEKPRLSIITPTLPDNHSITSDRQLPEVVDAETVGGPTHMENEYQPPAEPPASLPPPRTSMSSGPAPLGFREIMGKPTSDERVQAFNETREQFSAIDTGLSHWIQVTVHAHPEHSDVVDQSFKMPTGEPKHAGSKGKFPKLPSLGTFATSGSHQSPSPSGSGHARKPSVPLGTMMNKQQVEQRSKDLLHSAGMLGGQAGKTAKSLFAKGRSKFKGGGGDKGFQSSRGIRRNLRLSEIHLWPDIDVAALREDQAPNHGPCAPLKGRQRSHRRPIQRKPLAAPSLPAIAKNPATLRRKPAATTKNPPLPPGSRGRSSISSLDAEKETGAPPSLSRRPNHSSLSLPLGRFAPCRLVADRDREPRPPRSRPSSLPRLQLTMPKERNPLGRLFGRHKHDRPQSMEHLPTSTPRTRDLLGGDNHLNVPRPHSFQGQPPPLEGYFAPDNKSPNLEHGTGPAASPSTPFHSPPLNQGHTHSHSHSYSHSHSRSYSHSNPHLHRLSNSISFTNSNNSSQVSLHPSIYGSATPQLSPDNHIPSLSRPQSSRSRGRSPSPERSYAQNLHLRSRSPKAFAPRPQERVIPRTDPNDPAYHLGTFRSNPRTSRIGDQERPWKLTIPGMEGDSSGGERDGEEDGTLLWLRAQGHAHVKAERELEMKALDRSISRDSQDVVYLPQSESRPDVSNGKLPSYEEDIARYPPPRSFSSGDEKPASSHAPGAPTDVSENGDRGRERTSCHPTRGQARVLNRRDMPVELPVRGETESNEEIVMSSTAYPGQEWKPLGLGDWEY